MTNERKPERGSERISLSHRGPQHFPAEFRDPNFHYRWTNYDPESPWKAMETERLGYDPVPIGETNHLKSKIFAQSTIVREGYVTCPLKKGGQAVLMRLPMDVYLERQKQKEEDRKAERKAMLAEGMEVSDGTTLKQTYSFTNTPNH